MRVSMVQRLPELIELERLVEKLGTYARTEVLGHASHGNIRFPLYGLAMGTEDPKAPTLALVGGVHGLERIGSQVLLSYLRTLSELITWDTSTQELLSQARIVWLPITNPGGMYLTTRANPNGVDLMRNAPVEAEELSSWALHGGQRLSARLPWFRGVQGKEMEVEAKALCTFIEKHCFPSVASIALDVHSGFGTRDRLWFPYAKTKRPFPHLPEVFSLKQLLDRTYPNHVYVVEPQSKQYTTHGDLWDYLYDEQRKKFPNHFFLPLTLELGSWLWAKKNLRQVFSILGAFNPLIPHRLQRTLRRHLLLFEFLHRAILAFPTWATPSSDKRDSLKVRAMEYWYE